MDIDDVKTKGQPDEQTAVANEPSAESLGDFDLTEEAEQLYERLLRAFGGETPVGIEIDLADPDQEIKFIAEREEDFDLLVTYFREERRQIGEAFQLVHLLDHRIAQLRSTCGSPLLNPRKYQAQWKAIIVAWNKAVSANKWSLLACLCDVCGKPVGLRVQRLKGGKQQRSTVCSNGCRATRKELRRKQRRRASQKEPNRTPGQ